MSSSEEWKVVTSQDKRRVIRSGQRRALPNGGTPLTDDKAWTEETRRAVIKTVSECRSALTLSNFYQGLKDSVMERNQVEQIVCYGVGNLSASPTSSMWQLACALAIREGLLESDDKDDIPLLFFDPCTTKSEDDVMTSEWNIQVISENERAKRSVNGLTTLFFMPHCPLLLYGNVLWANWKNLNQVILFGNSLPLYKERVIEKKTIPASISLLLPFVKEQRVDVSKREEGGRLERAFNDCYLTWFSIDNDDILPPRPSELCTQDNDDGEVV